MEAATNKSVSNRLRRLPTICKICEAPALYSYFGVIVCNSCKMFFKRNACHRAQLQCSFNNNCQITQSNRYLCPACRLGKCFSNGMQTELFRASRSQPNKRSRNTTYLVMSQVQQLPTLSLLRSDQSTLTRGQWNLISNIIHCYDEHSGLSIAQTFAQEQRNLPIKMRFKLAPVGELFGSIVGQSQFLFEKNQNFISLCPHDRSILLNNAMKYIGGIGSSFILRHARLFDDTTFYKTVETIYGSASLSNGIRAISQIDFDNVFIKLALGLVIFSTFDYVQYSKSAPINLMNPEQVLNIQNIYADLSWRYLLYKYGHNRAVIYFSNFIRCIFSVNASLVAALELQHYNDLLDSLVEQTEEVLTMRM